MKYTLNYEKLESFRHKHKLSKKAFCDKCEISVYLYDKMMTGFLGLKVEQLITIAKVVDIPIQDLICEEYGLHTPKRQQHIIVFD
ncbi:MAG: helix-turn-helix transcriptional regulator [Clostridia bacterium]|nr:helix-turn-helix transcriptional regulator [Clostridia bacterium]